MNAATLLRAATGSIPSMDWALLGICATGFAVFYACDFRRWGILSFASFFFGFNYFLKIVVMYPFAWSPGNIAATRGAYEGILAHLGMAFHLTLVGFCCLLLGIFVARRFASVPPRGCLAIYRILARGWLSGGGVALGAGAALGGTLLLFLLGFQPFQARSLVFERNDLRPIYNLWSQLVPFFAVNAILFGVTARRRTAVVVGLLLAALGILGGNRTVTVLTLMQVAVMLAMPRRLRNIALMLLGALALVLLAMWISMLRMGPGKGSLDILDALLYGNNLSDLRDFAWILTGMDSHAFYLGRTYLAGYLDFIPAYLFPFRVEYGFGRVTPALAGLDPMFHSGLRPPIFGEMYVNFALPGVIFGGFLYGFLVGRILHWVNATLERPRGMTPEVVLWAAFLMLQIVDAFVFTPSFFGVYVLAGLLVAGAMLARLAARKAAA